MRPDPPAVGRRPAAGLRRLASQRRYVPLLHRVAGLNVLLVVVAVVVTILVLAPARLSTFTVDEEAIVLLGAVALALLVNVYLLRRLIGPVQALTALARRADLTSPGQHVPVLHPASEAGELALTFNNMLTRLQAERREATGRILAAQEAERLRIAQELHDQVGQELTAVLLGLSRVQSQAPEGQQRDLIALQDVVRASLEDVRRIAIELRPEALDDLGLQSALAVLAERFSEPLRLEVSVTIDPDLPPLAPGVELVVYRVAQEALTNVARHSGARRADLRLSGQDERLSLVVRDHGRGLPAETTPGTGMRGMRERAALIGASVQVGAPSTGTGCEVRLDVPMERAG